MSKVHKLQWRAKLDSSVASSCPLPCPASHAEPQRYLRSPPWRVNIQLAPFSTYFLMYKISQNCGLNPAKFACSWQKTHHISTEIKCYIWGAHGHLHERPEGMEASQVPDQWMHHFAIHLKLWHFKHSVSARYLHLPTCQSRCILLDSSCILWNQATGCSLLLWKRAVSEYETFLVHQISFTAALDTKHLTNSSHQIPLYEWMNPTKTILNHHKLIDKCNSSSNQTTGKRVYPLLHCLFLFGSRFCKSDMPVKATKSFWSPPLVSCLGSTTVPRVGNCTGQSTKT